MNIVIKKNPVFQIKNTCKPYPPKGQKIRFIFEGHNKMTVLERENSQTYSDRLQSKANEVKNNKKRPIVNGIDTDTDKFDSKNEGLFTNTSDINTDSTFCTPKRTEQHIHFENYKINMQKESSELNIKKKLNIKNKENQDGLLEMPSDNNVNIKPKTGYRKINYTYKITVENSSTYKLSTQFVERRRVNINVHYNTHCACPPGTYRCNRTTILEQNKLTQSNKQHYTCKYCNYECIKKNQLDQHERIHTQEKFFGCTFCDYKCIQKSHLDQHVRKHTGFKPFSCTLCDYKCIQKSHLDQHMRKHTGVKPFLCKLCDYKCIQKSQLDQHKRIHTQEKPFVCTFCDYKCIQKGHLAQHIKNKHEKK